MSPGKGPKQKVAHRLTPLSITNLLDLCCHHPLKKPNILLNCSNYGPKISFIEKKKIQENFLKINKYKILNYYI